MSFPATILVVDDNATNLKLAASVLEFDGHHVIRAREASQALLILRGVQPDLILLDLQLPGMDGLTLTRVLKKDPLCRHIPIVAMTAFAMKGDEERSLEAGCDGYIAKPIDTRKLSGQIESIMLSRLEHH